MHTVHNIPVVFDQHSQRYKLFYIKDNTVNCALRRKTTYTYLISSKGIPNIL